MPQALPHTSPEPLYFPMRTGFPGAEDIDPTTFPVFGMLVADVTAPAESDVRWTACTWTTSENTHYVTFAYAGNLAAGTWQFWAKLIVSSGNHPIRGPRPVVLT